jgi:uncharacterized protein (TIGR02996 family)
MPRPKRAAPAPARPQVLAFLRDIKENPEDDTPRLILADWLEEHGDEADVARAEFIRLQCQVARLPVEGLEAKSLQEKAKELSRRHCTAWLGPLLEVMEKAWLSPASFIARHLLPFDRALVSLLARGQTFASKRGLALADTEAYAWVDSLRFQSVSPRALATIAQTTLLAGLNTLSFRDCPLRVAGARALAESPYLECLTTLDLHHCWIENGGIAALTAGARSSKLREIDLYHNFLSSTGVEKLANWRGVANVERLDLSVNVFDVRGARALARSRHLGKLTYLNLHNCFIGDEAVAALVSGPGLANVTALRLTVNKLGDAGADALVATPHLPRLRRLHVSRHDHRLSQSGWARLCEHFGEVLVQ